MLKNKRIIVTGGAGFIGCNLVRTLTSYNDVIVIDNFSSGKMDNLTSIKGSLKVIRGSITDLKLLRTAFRDCDVVFHMAALPSVAESISHPLATNETNVLGTLNVLIAARDRGVAKVVYASSSAVYGNDPHLPKYEDMQPDPISPYAVSKVAGENYCRVFSSAYGLYTISLRFFNVYGPYQNPNLMYAAAVPKFISACISGIPITIYGDGTQTRDFIFIDDVIKINMLAAESRKASGMVFNAANGLRISINQLVKMIMKLTGNDVSLVYAKPRSGDVRHSVADISQAKKFLGYRQEFTLNEGLKRTIKHLTGYSSPRHGL